MNIIVTSDIHGLLPEIKEPADLLLICGDIIPLSIQRNDAFSKQWLSEVFVPWANSLPVEYVVMIPGNHDFYFYNLYKKNELPAEWHISEKVIMLTDASFEYKRLKIFGIPWITGLPNWAFNNDTPGFYDSIIQGCDILLTHEPPACNELGLVHQQCWNYLRDFSSTELYEAIRPGTKYVFCGHVHTGNHVLSYNKEKDFWCANVSYIDEDYKVTYEPLRIEI